MEKINEKIKILFLYRRKSTFVEKDLKFLSKNFEVESVKCSNWKCVFKILSKIINSDIVFSWFAGDHAAFSAFFSIIFKKKAIVVVGGGDVANQPEIGYGRFNMSLYKQILTKFALKHSVKILVVDPGLKKDIFKLVNINENKISYVPTGHDFNYWIPGNKKTKMVLTVAIANDISRMKLKGLDTFIESAKFFPDTRFVIVGVTGEAKKYLEKKGYDNVELIDFLSEGNLLNYYQKAKVFCLLSLREGLPTVLCEAMLCECVPVGTDVQGVKTAISDVGFYVKYGDVKSTVEGIQKALNTSDNIGKKARERIMKDFTMQRRQEEIKKIINEMKR